MNNRGMNELFHQIKMKMRSLYQEPIATGRPKLVQSDHNDYSVFLTMQPTAAVPIPSGYLQAENEDPDSDFHYPAYNTAPDPIPHATLPPVTPGNATRSSIPDWLKSLNAFPKPPDISEGLGKRQNSIDLVNLAKFAAQKLELAVRNQDLFLYDPPRWRALDPKESMVKLRELFRNHECDEALTSRDYREIYQLLLIEPDIQREKDFSPRKHCLNLLDGTLDLLTLELHDHNPKDEFLTFLNLGYDEICNPGNGEVFERFVANASNGDDEIRVQILELIALAITGYEIKHFYALLGPSNTGKTQLGRFLEELLGRDNVASVAGIHDFANRFTTSALAGKLLGTCLDLPDEPLPAIAIGIIKQLVGDDPIKVEAKYKDSRTIYRKPLMLFCGNHPIRIPEAAKEEAFLNRQVIIPFHNPIPDEKQQQALYELLLQEAPYIVAHAIQAYRDLIGRQFVVTRAAVPAEYETEDSRPNFRAVQDFVDQCCVMGKNYEISTEMLYQAYQTFISYKPYPQLTKVDFSRMLAEVLNNSAHPIKRAGASSSRGYRGIRLCQDLQ